MIEGHPYKHLKWYHRRQRKVPTEGNNRHCAVSGSSGVGKTVLDYALFKADVDAGKSVVQIDTHRDLFTKCLRYCMYKNIPPERVVIIDPCHQPDLYGAVQIALLEVLQGEIPYESADGVVSSFKAIFQGGLMERGLDVLRHACLTCQQANLSVCEIPLLLTDEAFRQAVLETVTDHDVLNFWEHMSRMKDFAGTIESVRNKVSAFVLNPFLRSVLAATRSSINFFEFWQQPSVTLVLMSRDHLKEESRGLLGSVLMQKFHQAILQRQRLPEKERYPLSIYADESHEYYTPDAFLPILEGARKWNVGLKMLFQSFSQFPPDDVDVILGTVGSIISFAVGRKDAERLAKEMCTFSGRQVKDQSRNIWGATSKPSYYSVQEELEHAIAEIKEANIGECFVYTKGTPWFGTVVKPEDPPEQDEHEYRLESAKHHARPLPAIAEDTKARIDRFMRPAQAELYAGPPEREPRRRKR